jgi:hypothetical protein
MYSVRDVIGVWFSVLIYGNGIELENFIFSSACENGMLMIRQSVMNSELSVIDFISLCGKNLTSAKVNNN